jgi:hypothetical protein
MIWEVKKKMLPFMPALVFAVCMASIVHCMSITFSVACFSNSSQSLRGLYSHPGSWINTGLLVKIEGDSVLVNHETNAHGSYVLVTSEDLILLTWNIIDRKDKGSTVPIRVFHICFNMNCIMTMKGEYKG